MGECTCLKAMIISHETVIFVKYFDLTFIVYILTIFTIMIFKFTPKSNFFKSKKTFSIQNNNLIELMMYIGAEVLS